MLRFFSNGTITESKLITGIKLQDNHDHLNPKNITVTQFKGATVVDPNLGNYVVLDFTVTDAAALDIDHIILMNDEQPVADSADKNLRIVKEAGKNLKIRLAAQFDGAEHCKFNTTSVNLPYATSFRDGVVRFANVTTNYGDTGWNITDNEENKSGTVYSADVVDKKISQEVTSSLGNLNQYAKKAEPNEFTAANTFTAGITVNGEIGGTAVTDAGTAGDKHIVNVGYADNKYLSKDIAATTYLTQENAANTYLSKDDAGKTYLTQENATNTYLTKQAAANYAKLDGGNTFTGAKNTFQEVSATKFSGNGVVKSITSNTLDDAEFIPTDGAVKKYVDSKTGTLTQNITTLQEKDNDLQSQIDGINAGQNLADIVNNTTELAGYDVSHLKAKGDYQHGTEGATWAIGDKVQVLGDAKVQSSVYELIKGTKPTGEESKDIQSTNNTAYYWRYIGVYGINAYTKAEINEKVDAINSAISTKADKSYVDTELGKKANTADVYSKTEADVNFAVKTGDNTFTGNNTFNGASTTINGTIFGNAVSSAIADDVAGGNGARLTTCGGVSSFVDNKIKGLNLDNSYLKLNSDAGQEVNSSVDFNGTIGGTAVAAVVNQTEDGRKLVTVDYVNDNCAQLGAANTFTGATNTFQAITATTVSAQAFHGEGVATQVINPDIPNQVTTTLAVTNFVNDKLAENRGATSDKTKVGAMGLFLYTGGDSQEMGATVSGTSLQAVGMQLPMDGVVSWSQGAAMPTNSRWKLLNNTIAGEPCLVLAIRVE